MGLAEGRDALLRVQSIAAQLQREAIVERTLSVAFELLDADAAALVLTGEQGPFLAGRAVREATRIKFVVDPAAARAAGIRQFGGARVVAVIEAGERALEAGRLIAPLAHGSRCLGALELERAAEFSADDQALVQLLTTQTALALIHAERHANLRAATQLLQDAVGSLEQLLVERTGELHETSARLREAMEVRRKYEDDRDRLQQSIIELQRERLRELSTPMIPITDRILVMPLIGTMDQDRAEQLLEVALTGVERSGARAVILDVTGLTHMDSSTAATLLRCARALRLLGATVVVTGIQPGFAQILASEGVELELATERTLQRGLIRALRSSAR